MTFGAQTAVTSNVTGTADFVAPASTMAATGTFTPAAGDATGTAAFIAPASTMAATGTFTANAPPVVSAGPNQTITLPDDNAQLAGTATDTDPLTLLWTKISGPSTVTFDDDSIGNAVATFGAMGTYYLRFSADDGYTTVTSAMRVRVLPIGGASGSAVMQPIMLRRRRRLTITSRYRRHR